MRTARLSLAFPDTPKGRVLILGADGTEDLSVFDYDETVIIEQMAQNYVALKARGFTVTTSAKDAETFDVALVTLPRARAAGRARIAQAASLLKPDGELWIDGQKTDGIQPVINEINKLGEIAEIYSKAHGKIVRLNAPSVIPMDWSDQRLSPAPGFTTRSGIFSAEVIDPGSAELAAALPDKLPTRIVDLGAGWGWLSAQILTHHSVEVLHLVEADYAALECARDNIKDSRANFHWTDARTFKLPEPVNGVIMNPPFHQSRSADPGLGSAFIRVAASLLTGAGRLWMVANRHLPYEAELSKHFSDVSEIGGSKKFKILTASGANSRHRRSK